MALRRGQLLIGLFALTSACASAEDEQGAFGPPARVDSATAPDTFTPIDTSIAPDTAPRADSADDTNAATADTERVDSESVDSGTVDCGTVDSTVEPDTLADSPGADATIGDAGDIDTTDSSDTTVSDTAADSTDDARTDADACIGPCPMPPYEIESNNTLATATPQWPSTTTWIGAIEPYGDHDYFTFTLTAPAIVELVTHNVAAPTLCSHDTFIRLFDPSGLELTSDDDDGVGTCSHLETMSPLPAGKYYVSVNEFGDNATISGYQLDIILK